MKAIKKEVTRLKKEYYNDDLIDELNTYVKFFRKPEIGSIVPTATPETIIQISALVLEMLSGRERVLEVMLGAKKARNRLKILEQKFLKGNSKAYFELKNNEQRATFSYGKQPALSRGLQTTKSLIDQCDLVLKHLDNHTRGLRDLSYSLGRLVNSGGE